MSLVDDARASGARVLQPAAHAAEVLSPAGRQLPLTIVVNPQPGSRVDQEEIFRPVLSVYTYRFLDQAIALVNSKPKALALYVLGWNRQSINRIVTSTSTGGVTVNAAAPHAMSGIIGFGGVGPSGMGRYKGGRVGFDAFSNTKAVVHASRLLLRLAGENAAPPFRSDRARNNLLRMARLPKGARRRTAYPY